MIPGAIIRKPGDIELNAGRKTVTVTVANTGADRFGVATTLKLGARKREACGSTSRPGRPCVSSPGKPAR
jgi:hypothetical protein